MLLLAIESSAQACSAALVWCSALGGDRSSGPVERYEGGKGQADRLIGLVDRVLAAAEQTYADVDLIAVGVGPGSFTGIRTAVAAARGLALAMDRPVLPVSTFDALASAATVPEPAPLVAVLDARRGELYAQPFAADRAPAGPPSVAPPAEAAALVHSRCWLVGTGAPLLVPHLDPRRVAGIDPIPPDALGVAEAARAQLARGVEPIVGFAVRPRYLREPDARPMRPRWPAAATASPVSGP